MGRVPAEKGVSDGEALLRREAKGEVFDVGKKTGILLLLQRFRLLPP
jgi:hypothetical protein